jgi:hypothetical protein
MALAAVLLGCQIAALAALGVMTMTEVLTVVATSFGPVADWGPR